jgi:hypothetical protein
MTRSCVRARQDRPDAALLAGEGSILGPRGPWPWYVLFAAMLGLAVLLVLKALERESAPDGRAAGVLTRAAGSPRHAGRLMRLIGANRRPADDRSRAAGRLVRLIGAKRRPALAAPRRALPSRCAQSRAGAPASSMAASARSCAKPGSSSRRSSSAPAALWRPVGRSRVRPAAVSRPRGSTPRPGATRPGPQRSTKRSIAPCSAQRHASVSCFGGDPSRAPPTSLRSSARARSAASALSRA